MSRSNIVLALLAAVVALGVLWVGYDAFKLSQAAHTQVQSAAPQAPAAPTTPTQTAPATTTAAPQVETSMPAVVGQQLPNAQGLLSASGFQVSVSQQHSPQKKGVVIATVPSAASQVEAGASVSLVVSSGPESVKVPRTRGLTLASARRRLRKAGFEVVVRKVSSTLFRRGMIVSEHPGAGSHRARGSVVELRLIAARPAPKTTAVPAVAGKSQKQALRAVAASYLQPIVQTQQSPQPAGTVISVSPSPATTVQRGSSVILVVSSGEPQSVQSTPAAQAPSAATTHSAPTVQKPATTKAPARRTAPARTKTTPEPKPTPSVPADTPQPPALPGNGKIVFSSRRDGNDEIYVMNADGTGAVDLTNDGSSDRSPAVSPDGKRVAFVSNRGGNRDIFVMPVTGGDPVNITHSPADDFDPTFAADGKTIVFVSNRKGNYGIYAMNTDGSGVRLIAADGGDDFSPAISPDGKTVVFESNRSGNYNLYAVAVGGGKISQLTTGSANNSNPAFSPDGSKIVFSSDRSGASYDLYTMNPDGSTIRKLYGSDGDDLSPVFSPDGKKIVFSSDRSGTSSLYVVNADGSSIRQISNNSDSSPAWQPLP